MLMLEFKLFAVRHPKLRPQLAAIHRRIRASMNLDVIYKLPGIEPTDKESKSAALAGVMAGLFLEYVYDPERFSEQQAGVFLGQIFDSLLSIKLSRSLTGTNQEVHISCRRTSAARS